MPWNLWIFTWILEISDQNRSSCLFFLKLYLFSLSWNNSVFPGNSSGSLFPANRWSGTLRQVLDWCGRYSCCCCCREWWDWKTRRFQTRFRVFWKVVVVFMGRCDLVLVLPPGASSATTTTFFNRPTSPPTPLPSRDLSLALLWEFYLQPPGFIYRGISRVWRPVVSGVKVFCVLVVCVFFACYAHSWRVHSGAKISPVLWLAVEWVGSGHHSWRGGEKGSSAGLLTLTIPLLSLPSCLSHFCCYYYYHFPDQPQGT